MYFQVYFLRIFHTDVTNTHVETCLKSKGGRSRSSSEAPFFIWTTLSTKKKEGGLIVSNFLVFIGVFLVYYHGLHVANCPNRNWSRPCWCYYFLTGENGYGFFFLYGFFFCFFLQTFTFGNTQWSRILLKVSLSILKSAMWFHIFCY